MRPPRLRESLSALGASPDLEHYRSGWIFSRPNLDTNRTRMFARRCGHNGKFNAPSAPELYSSRMQQEILQIRTLFH
jgi:hypothetical protein